MLKFQIFYKMSKYITHFSVKISLWMSKCHCECSHFHSTYMEQIHGCLIHQCRMNHSKGGLMISLQAHAVISECDISDVGYGIRCIQNSRVCYKSSPTQLSLLCNIIHLIHQLRVNCYINFTPASHWQNKCQQKSVFQFLPGCHLEKQNTPLPNFWNFHEIGCFRTYCWYDLSSWYLVYLCLYNSR